MSAKVPSEHAEQVTFLAEFERAYPGVRIFAIPNGGLRNVAVAKKLKQEGVRKGVPDLFIPAWLIWVEMKKTKGSATSAEQKDWHEYLRSIGHTVVVGKGWVDAMHKVRESRQ